MIPLGVLGGTELIKVHSSRICISQTFTEKRNQLREREGGQRERNLFQGKELNLYNNNEKY